MPFFYKYCSMRFSCIMCLYMLGDFFLPLFSLYSALVTKMDRSREDENKNVTQPLHKLVAFRGIGVEEARSVKKPRFAKRKKKLLRYFKYEMLRLPCRVFQLLLHACHLCTILLLILFLLCCLYHVCCCPVVCTKHIYPIETRHSFNF